MCININTFGSAAVCLGNCLKYLSDVRRRGERDMMVGKFGLLSGCQHLCQNLRTAEQPKMPSRHESVNIYFDYCHMFTFIHHEGSKVQ